MPPVMHFTHAGVVHAAHIWYAGQFLSRAGVAERLKRGLVVHLATECDDVTFFTVDKQRVACLAEKPITCWLCMRTVTATPSG